MNKIKEIFKKIFANKKILFIIVGAILLVAALIVFLYVNSHKLTKLEKIKITEFSDKYADYMDEVEDSKDDKGRYINFAIEYLYNNSDKDSYPLDEVLNIINEVYDVSYSDEDIQKIGISEGMLNKGIVYDSGENSFKYNISKTRADIAATPIVKYNIQKIKKINKNNFEVIYDKYTVENPYEILNYFDKYNIEKEDPEEKIDTKDIIAYLKGETKVGVIKKLITKDNIKEFGKIDGDIKIKLVIKNNKLIIDKK